MNSSCWLWPWHAISKKKTSHTNWFAVLVQLKRCRPEIRTMLSLVVERSHASDCETLCFLCAVSGIWGGRSSTSSCQSVSCDSCVGNCCWRCGSPLFLWYDAGGKLLVAFAKHLKAKSYFYSYERLSELNQTSRELNKLFSNKMHVF